MDSFERFNEEKLQAKKYFYSSLKDGNSCSILFMEKQWKI